jgi:hypothetical protein
VLLPYYVPHARDLAPSNLPQPILGTRSTMGGEVPLSRGDSKGARSGRGGEMFDFGF